MPINYDEAHDELPVRKIVKMYGDGYTVVEVAGFEVPLDNGTANRVKKAMSDGDWDEVGKILAGVGRDGDIPDHETLRHKARIAAQMTELQKQLAELDTIPKEPRPEDSPNGVAVLTFNKKFGGNTTYTYAAIRIHDHWAVTGRNHRGTTFTWHELWKFINGGEQSAPMVWFANGFEQVI